MLKRLRLNMTLLCAAGVTVIGAALVLVSLAISEGQLTQRGQALFNSAADTIAFRLGTDAALEWEWLSQVEADGGLFAHIEDNGAALLFSGRDEDRTGLAQKAQRISAERYGVDTKKRPVSALNSNRAVFRMDGADGGEYRVCVVVMRTQNGWKSLTALGKTTGERAMILRQRLIYLGMLAASVLAFFGFSWWFTGRAVRPIAQSQKRQTEFIAAASHELRTPLAVIRTNAAALKSQPEDGVCGPFAAAIERECIRSGKLVDELLVLANADAGSWRADIAPVELLPLITESAGAFLAAAKEKKQRLELKLPGSLPVIAGDEYRLRQLCAILLENALSYTPEGGLITLNAFTGGKFISFSVADNGPGIPPGEADRVFERFYRVDKSRSDKEHYGLGLSIAKEIAQLHRGSISLSETPGGGLTVTVNIPKIATWGSKFA